MKNLNLYRLHLLALFLSPALAYATSSTCLLDRSKVGPDGQSYYYCPGAIPAIDTVGPGSCNSQCSTYWNAIDAKRKARDAAVAKLAANGTDSAARACIQDETKMWLSNAKKCISKSSFKTASSSTSTARVGSTSSAVVSRTPANASTPKKSTERVTATSKTLTTPATVTNRVPIENAECLLNGKKGTWQPAATSSYSQTDDPNLQCVVTEAKVASKTQVLQPSTTKITLPDGTVIEHSDSNHANNGVAKNAAVNSKGDFVGSDYDYTQIKGQKTAAIEGGLTINREGTDTVDQSKIDGYGGLAGKAAQADKRLANAQGALANDKAAYKANQKAASQVDQDFAKGQETSASTADKLASTSTYRGADGTSQETAQDRDGFRASKKTEKAEIREAKKDAKSAEKQHALESNQLEIREENKDKQYGGKYGAAKVETTQQVNGAVTMLGDLATKGADYIMQQHAGQTQANLASQGAAATQQDAINAQVEDLKDAASSNSKLGLTTSVLGVLQGSRILAHAGSKSKIATAASLARDATDSDLKAQLKIIDSDYNAECAKFANNPAGKQSCEAERAQKISQANDKAQIRENNTVANTKGEKAAQSAAVLAQSLETAKTAGKAAMMYANAASLRNAADKLKALSTATNNGFAFNPGSGDSTTTDPTAAAAPDTGAIVAEGTDEGPALDAGNNQINPNLQDPGIGNIAPDGKFVAAAPSGGGAAGGGGLGASGGTQAAKDDKAGEAPTSNKNQAGGGYASDGPAGSGYKRGSEGGSGGVGLDSGLADMFKKMFEGDDKKGKDDKAFALDDRSPASDKAAVIPRNGDIFKEVSKRYKVKNTEGAIVF